MILFTIADPDTIEYVADWVELFIILNSDSISKSTLTSLLAQEKSDDPSATFIDDVWLELDYRRLLYGSNPPFGLKASSVTSIIKKEDN